MKLIDADQLEKDLSSLYRWLIDRISKGYGTTNAELLDKVFQILREQKNIQ